MNNNVFFLRLLPENALLQVIRSFDYVNLIAFSLISSKTKALVKSLNLVIDTLSVDIQGYEHPNQYSLRLCLFFYNGSIEFEIYRCIDKKNTPGIPLIGLDEVSKFVHFSSDLEGYFIIDTFTWVNPGLSFTGWFEHFGYLFTLTKSRFRVCTEDEIFDTVAIRNLFPDWTDVIIDIASCNYAEKMFELFPPCTKNFDAGVIDDLFEIPQIVGIQNLDDIDSFHPLKFDDLLILNARDITVHNFSISDANRFIKFWTKGSNPRMKSLFMFLTEEGSEENLFKGITHQTMSLDLERMKGNRVIRGGIDIRSKKGILATIEICNRTPPSITMHVWE